MHSHLQRILFYLFYFTPGRKPAILRLSDSAFFIGAQKSPEKVQGPDSLGDLSSPGKRCLPQIGQ